ncbi:DUF6153 family protein [Streptomyces sp. NPDC053560]|uniref:DUF6153 family protein n=1 Tax=Streptomyces sp. NPDC053560 TaxID=3365711 RepID=UPI0037D81B36
MVTALRSSALLRARPQMAGPLRVFWLAALLLGLLYTHGVSGESAAAHAAPGATASASSTVPATQEPAASHHHDGDSHHHDGDGTGHTADHCASGQPPHGADLPTPCMTPLDVTPVTHVRTLAAARTTELGAASDGPRDPAILRV